MASSSHLRVNNQSTPPINGIPCMSWSTVMLCVGCILNPPPTWWRSRRLMWQNRNQGEALSAI